MAVKSKKINPAAPPVIREDSDLQDLLGLHFQASRRVEEVLEQDEELKSAGKIAAAKVMLLHAQGIQQGLHAMEVEVRMSTRAPRTHALVRKTVT